MYLREAAQPAAKKDNDSPSPRRSRGHCSGGGGWGGVERAPCSEESEMGGRNCSSYTKDANHTNTALQN